jgi:hypothetical protein
VIGGLVIPSFKVLCMDCSPVTLAPATLRLEIVLAFLLVNQLIDQRLVKSQGSSYALYPGKYLLNCEV